MTFYVKSHTIIVAEQSERVLRKEEAKKLEEKTSRQLSNWLTSEEGRDDLVALHYEMKPQQAELLDKLLFHSDYSDWEQMEETVYRFGKSLASKDLLGRALFVCMATLMHNTNLLEQTV